MSLSSVSAQPMSGGEYDLLPCNDIKSDTPGPGAYTPGTGLVGKQVSSRSPCPPTVRFGSATRKDMQKVFMGKEYSKPQSQRPDPPHPTSIESLLEPMNLSEYASAMVELGYDQPSDLLEMGEAKLQELATAVRMKPGHAARLVKRMVGPSKGVSEVQPAATAGDQRLDLTVATTTVAKM